MARNISLLAPLVVCFVTYAALAGDMPAGDFKATTEEASGAVKMITSFEKDSPFVHQPITLEDPDFEKQPPDTKAQIVTDHATDGQKALKIQNGSLTLVGPLDWSGYDYLKIDVFSDAKEPKLFMLLLEDDNTQGKYWWQGQVFAPIMPGKNSLIFPIAGSRGGGKGRPGKPLQMNKLTKVSFKIFKGDVWSCDYSETSPMYLDNIRLENDTDAKGYVFGGLLAYDVGSEVSPLMPGFKRLSPSDLYTKEKGFGLLKDSRLPVQGAPGETSLDFYRPDPLYRDMISLEKGGFAFDLPNGKYHVFMNIDFGAGFWGDTQAYQERKVMANGKVVVDDKMTFAQFKNRYFSHFDIEDWPGLDVWEKYIKPCYHEKAFDVDVENGQLKLEYETEGLGCAVSAIVIYPADKAEQGEKFLKWVEAKRKWWFNVENNEIAHTSSGKDFAAAEPDQKRGFVLFERDLNNDVFYNDKPAAGEVISKLQNTGFKGQSVPMDLGIVPLQDLGRVTVTVGDLSDGNGAKIPGSSFDVGYIAYRVTRTTYEGTMYTMSPRYIRLDNSIAMPKDITRRFWLRVNVPPTAAPGEYKGQVTIATENAGKCELPIELKVLHGSLDATDIPAGPIGHSLGIRWPGNDPEAAAWNAKLTETSLRMLHDCGFTSFTGMPEIVYKGFKDGKGDFDFTTGDKQMKQARSIGFNMPILSYCGFNGLNIYKQDLDAMKAAGFKDYSEFLKAVFTAVQKHADENNWLPVYYVLGDEPAGKEDILAATENAKAYHKAFPSGPPWFTLFDSCVATDPDNPHLQLASNYHAVAWGGFGEGSVNALHKLGGQFGMYNWFTRWGYGSHLFKAVKQFDCKFLVSWHWNCAGGDPYFGLDNREDDFCWVNATPDGRLMSTPVFERVREGMTDYRCLITLDRLAREKADTPAGKEARALINKRMASFELGFIDGLKDDSAFRVKLTEAIDKINSEK